MIVLHGLGHEVTEPQIRWAIKSGQVSRPPLDGSLRFNFGSWAKVGGERLDFWAFEHYRHQVRPMSLNFTEQHLRELSMYFGVKKNEAPGPGSPVKLSPR